MKRQIKTAFIAMLSMVMIQCCYAQATAAGSWVPPSDRHIYYTGRIDFSNPDMPRLFWTSSLIEARFTGTSLKVILDDSTGHDTYHVVIDGNESQAFTLSCLKGKNVYTLAENLEGDDHKVLIAKRTEFSVGDTAFCGFILDTGKELSKLPLYQPRRRIEFFGDSITCGMGNEDESLVNNSDMNLENGYMTYAAMTARNLNAQAHMTSKSGIGFMVSWADIIMPDIYDRINPNDKDSKWDFSSWTPDIVVVNLGTNDSWLCNNRFMTPPSETQIIEAYVDFIRMLRKKYSEAFILCTLGNMNSTAENAPFPVYIQEAVNLMREKYSDNKLDTIFFPFKGTDGHPTISEHELMAGPLTEKISDIMDWDTIPSEEEPQLQETQTEKETVN